jgi:polyketide synthase PksN
VILNVAAGTVRHEGASLARPDGSVILNKSVPVPRAAAAAPSSASVEAPLAPAPSRSPQVLAPAVASPALAARLGELLAEALYMDPSELDTELPFVDMGLDSIIGLEWVKAVNEEFHLSINATKVYEHPTLEQFAALVGGLLGGKGESPAEPLPAVVAQPVAAPAPPAGMVDHALLQRELAAELASALFADVADIDPDMAFTDLGLDSVLGIEWLHAVNQKYGTAITAADIYDHPTLHQFSGFVASRLQGTTPAAPAATPVATPEAAPAAAPKAAALSLDEVLERVAGGLLDIDEASALLA